MKMQNVDFECDRSMTVPIPRGPNTVYFTATYVNDYSDFEALVPEPKKQQVIGKNGERTERETEEYKKEKEEYGLKRSFWIIYKSLEKTEGLVWETVKENDPDSWAKIDDELKAAKFSFLERSHLYEQVWTINGLNQKMIDSTQKLFFW